MPDITFSLPDNVYTSLVAIARAAGRTEKADADAVKAQLLSAFRPMFLNAAAELQRDAFMQQAQAQLGDLIAANVPAV